MNEIIDVVKKYYLIGEENVELLENGNILFTEDDGTIKEQSKEEFIRYYIELVNDLFNQHRDEMQIKVCINMLNDLKLLYEGLEILSFIKQETNN